MSQKKSIKHKICLKEDEHVYSNCLREQLKLFSRFTQNAAVYNKYKRNAL